MYTCISLSLSLSITVMPVSRCFALETPRTARCRFQRPGQESENHGKAGLSGRHAAWPLDRLLQQECSDP